MLSVRGLTYARWFPFIAIVICLAGDLSRNGVVCEELPETAICQIPDGTGDPELKTSDRPSGVQLKLLIGAALEVKVRELRRSASAITN